MAGDGRSLDVTYVLTFSPAHALLHDAAVTIRASLGWKNGPLGNHMHPEIAKFQMGYISVSVRGGF